LCTYFTFRSQFQFLKIMREINNTRIFVNEVETQDEKNHSGAAKPRISTIQKTRLDTR